MSPRFIVTCLIRVGSKAVASVQLGFEFSYVIPHVLYVVFKLCCTLAMARSFSKTFFPDAGLGGHVFAVLRGHKVIIMVTYPFETGLSILATLFDQVFSSQ